MVAISMAESHAIAELAKLMYSYLPGTFSNVTWPDVAAKHGLQKYWPGGSKLPAITTLLRNTIENHRDRFCDLVLTIVQEGIAYRLRKDNPITREDVDLLNQVILKLRFRIPELYDASFLEALPRGSTQPVTAEKTFSSPAVQSSEVESLRAQFLSLFAETNPQRRGYQFESFLNTFFTVHGLNPRGSFKIVGEQIDGSFEWGGNTFLVEARWRQDEANASDLLILRGKSEKSEWTRGLFLSINGFSEQANATFQMGRRANLIAMSGEDLMLVLEQIWTLHDALRAKLRHTGETGEAYKPLRSLQK